jgi:hypothetical protein
MSVPSSYGSVAQSAGQANGAADELLLDLMQGIHGSDMRLPDAGSSLPGASGSAAPEAMDLNGEVTRISAQALAGQRFVVASLQAPSELWALPSARETVFDGSVVSAEAPDAATAIAPTQTLAASAAPAASLWGGAVRDGQASDTLASDSFNNTAPHG